MESYKYKCIGFSVHIIFKELLFIGNYNNKVLAKGLPAPMPSLL